jgi:hypothetical protein
VRNYEIFTKLTKKEINIMSNAIKILGIGVGLLGLNTLLNKLFDEDDNETNSSNFSETVPNGSETVKQTDQTVQPEPLIKPIAIAKEPFEPLNDEPIHIHREENKPLESPIYTYTEPSEPFDEKAELSKIMSNLGKKSGEARRKKKSNI